MPDTQREQILRHLQHVGPITPLEALQLYNCMRLGARIDDLRRQGHCIVTRMVVVPSGKRVAEYHIPEKQTTLIFDGTL